MSSCWRNYPEWSEQTLTRVKNEIEHFKPPVVREARILLLGPVGAGKSSFFNTIASVFRGHVSAQACCGCAKQSITTKYRMYRLQGSAGRTPLHFRLCDTPGLEEARGIDKQELNYLLNGNIPDGYTFNPNTPISSDVSGFLPSPTLNDKIHCVCFVIDGSKVKDMSEKIIEKIKALQMTVRQRDVPVIIVLTKVDQICPEVDKDLTMIFQSQIIKELVNNVSETFGSPRSMVLPIMNYEREVDLNINMSLLALSSLQQILRTTTDFLFNFLELHEVNPLTDISTNHELQAIINASEDKIKQLCDTLENKEHNILELQSEMAKKNHEIDHQAHDLRQAVKEHEITRVEVKTLKDEVQSLKLILTNQDEEIAKLVQTIDTLENERDQLRRQIKVLKSSQKQSIEVQLYAPGTTNFKNIVMALRDDLNAHLEKDGMSVKLIECNRSTDVQSNIPTLVVCVNASRLEADVAACLQGLKLSPNITILVFHHKDEHALPSQTSDKVLSIDTVRSVGSIIDMAFLSDRGLYHCTMNTEAVQNIANLLQLQRVPVDSRGVRKV